MRMKRNPFTCLAGGRGGTFCMIMEWRKLLFPEQEPIFLALPPPPIHNVFSLILSSSYPQNLLLHTNITHKTNL